MNLKNRLILLESKIPVMQANRFIFTTVTGWDDSEIIALKYKELKILRVIGESFDDLKSRAEIFFDESNDDRRNKIFFIQSLYSENVSY